MIGSKPEIGKNVLKMRSSFNTKLDAILLQVLAAFVDCVSET